MKTNTETIVVIGNGAIGRFICSGLAAHAPRAKLSMVLDRKSHGREIIDGIIYTSDLQTALSAAPALAVECAGHAALAAYGPAFLQAGSDLLVASVGALADPHLLRALTAAAEASGACILVPSGALGGLDVLSAAKILGLDFVGMTSTKPTKAWRNTAAESMIDLESVSSVTSFYTGTAREAAKLFPQNTNVAAAVALAGIGFDRTAVTLAVDPGATENRHQIRASGAFGMFEISVQAHVLEANAKTSMLAPVSLLKAINSRTASLRLV